MYMSRGVPPGTISANPRAFGARCSKLVALLVVWAGLTRAASAQDAEQRSEAELDAPLLPVRISGQASLTWDGEFALGGRVDYPLIERGLLLSTRDEVSLSGGLDVAFLAFEGSDPLAYWPTATVMWSLGLTDRFVF